MNNGPVSVSALPDAAEHKTALGRPTPTHADIRLLQRDDFDRNVWCVMGAPIDVADVPSAVTTVEAAIRDGERLSFVTPNVNWLVRALKDKEARRQVIDADLSLADGAPLVAMAKMLGVPIAERTAGSDLFEALRQRPAFGRSIKVFFFGGRDGAAEAAFNSVNEDRGGMEAVGWLNPGFGDVEAMSSDAIIDKINAADPDFIVVALGAAKGQAWIDYNQNRLNASAIAHLGAVVDFTAGTVERAPKWVARSGLEWLWRIKADRALWKRYAKDGTALIGLSASRLPSQLTGGKGASSGTVASADISRTSTGQRIGLSGDLIHGQLGLVRKAFREAAKTGANVTLDLKDTGVFDRAFLGLVLMLEKHLTRSGGVIELMNATPREIRLFRSNAMDYRIVEDAEVQPSSLPAQNVAVS